MIIATRGSASRKTLTIDATSWSITVVATTREPERGPAPWVSYVEVIEMHLFSPPTAETIPATPLATSIMRLPRIQESRGSLVRQASPTLPSSA